MELFRPRLPFTSWRAKPGLGDPAHGYFARLVAEGQHVSARVYANELEINGRNIVMQELLDELLKLPLAEEYKQSLIRWTPILHDGFHRLAGETLRKRQMSFYTRRFCRACLAESAHHRVWWDIVDFHVCPFHTEPIEDRSAVGDRIKWWFPSFETDPDGEPLGRPASLLLEPDDFEWYVLSRFDCVESYSRPLLDGAPLHEVIDVCGAVGRLLANPWMKSAPAIGREDCRTGYLALSGSLPDLENAFVTWLESNVVQQDRNRGIYNGYGWFMPRGERNFLEAALWPDIDVAMRRAFAKTGRIGRQSAGVDRLPHKELTIKEAATAIGVDFRGLRAISQQAGITVKSSDPAMRAFLTEDQVACLHATVKDLISVEEASARLGCTQACVRDIVSMGMIKGFLHTRMFGHQGNGLAHLGSEVDALLERILAVPNVGNRGQHHGIAYLSKALGKSVADIVQSVLKGKMTVARLDRRRKGIASWRFEAVAYKKAYRQRVREKEVRAVEAAAVMQMQLDAIQAFVRAGVIKSRVGNDGQTYLDRASFEVFSSTYVNAKVYQDRLGCSDLELASRLEQLGIRRCHGKLRARNKIYLVERKSLEKVIGKLNDGGSDPPVWEAFRNTMASVCASFVIPPSSGGKVVKAYTATRSTYVELHVEGEGLLIRKTFSSHPAPREWKVFVANQRQIREEWKAFAWSKLNARGAVTAEFRIRTEDDVAVAAEALQCLYLHFRNPRSLPKG
ncbi:TniQ family protein [Sinorhizobium fredii]|uniref:TniQ family protein n=1 Tax=Rhizobium fredii TaxID=380 RepID=UPI00351869B5